MRGGSLSPCRLGTLGATGAVDAGPLERSLEDPHRGDRIRRARFEEFDADPPGTPARVAALDLAGPTQDGIGVGGSGAAASMVADDQAISPVVTEGPPEGADGHVGDTEFGGDLDQGLTADMTFDDILTCGEREGARHETSPHGVGGNHQ